MSVGCSVASQMCATELIFIACARNTTNMSAFFFFLCTLVPRTCFFRFNYYKHLLDSSPHTVDGAPKYVSIDCEWLCCVRFSIFIRVQFAPYFIRHLTGLITFVCFSFPFDYVWVRVKRVVKRCIHCESIGIWKCGIVVGSLSVATTFIAHPMASIEPISLIYF